MKCNVSLNSVYEVLKGFDKFKELYSIPEDVFYNKELCDAVRDIVKNSPCTYENAVVLMNYSKNYALDVIIIKELLRVGVSFEKVLKIIINLNTK